MKNSAILYLLLAIASSSCNSDQGIILQVNNPLDEVRSDAIILLSRGEISGWTNIPEGWLPVLKTPDGELIPCQADDVNGDGKWDELFALTDLEAGAQQKIQLGFVPAGEYPVFPSRTNLHLGDAENNYKELDYGARLEGVSYPNYEGRTSAVYQMEGVAWENDLVGFRNYMDQRNGMDIFGKTSTEMVLNEVGIAGADSYHEPGAWGMDVLKVGTSLGAGGIAYMYRDSLYRVGDNGSGSYKVSFEGTQRSRFKLDYRDWKVDDLVIEVSQTIEIIAGRLCYQSFVSYKGTEEKLSLVLGLVNMKSDQLHVLKLNDQYTALYTIDHQSEDGSLLAMALMVPSGYLKKTGETKNEGNGITQTYFAMLDSGPGDHVPYRFYALWEKEDSRWSSRAEVEQYLETEAERWTQSVIYSKPQ